MTGTFYPALSAILQNPSIESVAKAINHNRQKWPGSKTIGDFATAIENAVDLNLLKMVKIRVATAHTDHVYAWAHTDHVYAWEYKTESYDLAIRLKSAHGYTIYLDHGDGTGSEVFSYHDSRQNDHTPYCRVWGQFTISPIVTRFAYPA